MFELKSRIRAAFYMGLTTPLPLLALFEHGPMSDLNPLSEANRSRTSGTSGQHLTDLLAGSFERTRTRLAWLLVRFPKRKKPLKQERLMNRVLMILTVVTAIASIDLGSPSPARADAWGCSYEKCLAYCTKVGGQRCSSYCTIKLKDKQVSKVCPAS